MHRAIDSGLTVRARSAVALLSVVFGFATVSTAETADKAAKPNARHTPLSLEHALQLGVENSREVKSAKMDLEASRSEISKVTAEYFPTLNATAQAGTYHDRNPNPGDLQIPLTPRDRNEYQGKLDLAETVFSGFSTVAQADAAKAENRAQEHGLTATQMQARSDIIKTYFGIQTTKRKIQSEEEVLKLKKAQDERVRRRRSAGRATDLDSVQSEYAIHEQEPQLNTLRANLETQSLHLNRLLGADVSEQYELTDLLEVTQAALDKANIGKLADSFQKALDQNPDLKRLDALSDKARADLKFEDSKNLPNVSAHAFAGVDSYLQNEIGTQSSQIYGFYVQLQVPIFSGLSTLYTVQAEREKLNAAIERRALEREKLLEQTQSLYRQIDTNRQNLIAAKQNVDIAHRTVTRGEAQYEVGRATLTDVLNTYSQRLKAEEAYMDQLNQSIATQVELKSVIGQ